MIESGDAGGFTISTGDLGTFISVTIDTAVYDRNAVFRTAYWYTDICYLFIAKGDEPGILLVEFRSKNSEQESLLERLARDFCNRLVDQQVREIVAAETGNIRDALIEKAFFEGGKHLDPTILLSDESAVPSQGESYKDPSLIIPQDLR